MDILTNSRVLVSGKTGSGKTYLSEQMLAGVERLVIIDSKNSLAHWIPHKTLIDKAKEIISKPERRRIVPPIQQNLLSYYDEVFYQIYQQGNTTVYIDELYAVAPQRKPPPQWLQAIYTRGRERNIGVWACTQRPAWLPLEVLTESEHFFVFRLLLGKDRGRLAEWIGPHVMQIPDDKHGYWYYHTDFDEPYYYESVPVDESGLNGV